MKRIIFAFSFLLILIAIFFFINNKEELETEDSFNFQGIKNHNNEEGDKLAIAACPTFHYMLEKLSSEEINTIETKSTRESLGLIEDGVVDIIISGRALREEEPKFLSEIIGDGYDFISNKETVILEEEMKFIPFYTDLFLEEIIQDFNFITDKNLTKTENIYDDIDKGIVITVLESELKGEIVHIFQKNGERVRLSRLPRLYYPSHLEEEVNFIKEIIRNN